MDTMSLMEIKDFVLLATFTGVVGSVLYVAAATIRRKQQHAMQRYMLDKFSLAKDFAEFLQSTAGQKYVMNFSDVVTSPRNSILNSVKIGFVLIFSGAGFTANMTPLRPYAVSLGSVIVCTGLGFLVSAAASYFLFKRMARGEME